MIKKNTERKRDSNVRLDPSKGKEKRRKREAYGQQLPCKQRGNKFRIK